MVTFVNKVGQRFAVAGINDEMAVAYAEDWVAAGRPFGRKGMKWLALLFGVTVTFAGHAFGYDDEYGYTDNYATGRCGDGY